MDNLAPQDEGVLSLHPNYAWHIVGDQEVCVGKRMKSSQVMAGDVKSFFCWSMNLPI
jgi:hypothetical protein